MPVMLLWTLVAAALLVCDGESWQHAGPPPIVALVGEDVLLPCSFDILSSSEFPTVEWSKDRLDPDVVLLHRDGCEIQEMKHQQFEYRTSLIFRELRNGNVSLRLSAVRPSDQGTYRCKTLWTDRPDAVTAVQLDVVGVAMPTLLLTQINANGEVMVECRSGCWWPRPQVDLLGDTDNIIYPEEMEEDRSSHSCYITTMVSTLQSSTSSITCRVQHPRREHRLEAKLRLPALCVFNRHTLVMTALLVAVSSALLTLGLITYSTRCKEFPRYQRTCSSPAADTSNTSVDIGGEEVPGLGVPSELSPLVDQSDSSRGVPLAARSLTGLHGQDNKPEHRPRLQKQLSFMETSPAPCIPLRSRHNNSCPNFFRC